MNGRQQLDYETRAPLRRRRLSSTTLAILLAPTVIATFCLLGVPAGLAEGGFPDEGPVEAAVAGFLAAAFAVIGGILAMGRSVRLLIWNACIVGLGVGGFFIAVSP